MIISSADGRWARHVDHGADLFGTGHEYAVGLALARWELRPNTHPAPNTDYEFMEGIAFGLSGSRLYVVGSYTVSSIGSCKVSIPHAVQSDVDYSAHVVELDILLKILSNFTINLPDGSIYSFREILNRWQRAHQPFAVVSVKLAPPFTSKVLNSEWSLLHIVAISYRLCRSQLLVLTEPGDQKLSN